MGFSLPQKLKKLTQIAIHLMPSLKPPSKRSPAGGREVRGWRRARAGGGVCSAALSPATTPTGTQSDLLKQTQTTGPPAHHSHQLPVP